MLIYRDCLEKKKSLLLLFSVVLSLILFASAPAFAETDNTGGVDAQINVLYPFNISGAGEHLGGEVLMYGEYEWVDPDDLPEGVVWDGTLNYGDKITPIITDPEQEGDIPPMLLEAGYTFNDTRVGVSWFGVSAKDEQSGKVPGLYWEENETSEEWGYGYVSFWDMGIDLHASRGLPAVWMERTYDVDEDEEEIEFYPDKGATDWEASQEIDIDSIPITLQHPVLEEENLSFQVVGGVHHLRWNEDMQKEMEVTAHIEDTTVWSDIWWDEEEGEWIDVTVEYQDIFHNDITLETNTTVEYQPLGGLLGIEADWEVLPALSLSTKAHSSILRGQATFTGVGTDVDDIVETERITVYDEDGNVVEEDEEKGYEYLSGEFELPETTKSLTSLNCQLDLKANYNITENIYLSAGYFYTFWKDVPKAPQWSYSDPYTEPYGAYAKEDSWEVDRSADISTSSWKLGVGMTF